MKSGETESTCGIGFSAARETERSAGLDQPEASASQCRADRRQ
jgi:hypothetical protein